MFEEFENGAEELAELMTRARDTGVVPGRLAVGIGNADGDSAGSCAGEEDDFSWEWDAEEAAICLECPRKRCPLDRNKSCLRYRRAIRALRKKRAEAEN